MPSTFFTLLHILSWILVSAIFVMWIYSYDEEAYRWGKVVVVFLVGCVVGGMV